MVCFASHMHLARSTTIELFYDVFEFAMTMVDSTIASFHIII